MATLPSNVRRLSREEFGFQRLRPGQAEAIESALAGHDTLAVMPTGSGKSAIYQIAALLVDGPTLVVSPLIALQHDQVEGLAGVEGAEAAIANSLLPPSAKQAALSALAEGRIEFLFLAPEQLDNEETLARVREARPSLVVVDEAHCISAWGRDFRPDYHRQGAVIESLGHPTVLALTATAAPPVRAEIIERLGMRDPVVVIRGFDRPNIGLSVRRLRDPSEKAEALLETIDLVERPGIVYAATRRATEEVATLLTRHGTTAAAYHAGLSRGGRDDVQSRFMAGEVEVIVATTAVGMGIDKADVRFVIHHDIPESLDSYYHEIGRAGRDDEPAQAVLLYRPEDLGLRRFFASGQVDADVVDRLARAVSDKRSAALRGLARGWGVPEGRLTVAANLLADVGAAVVAPGGRVEARGAWSPEEIVAAALDRAEARRRVEQSRLEMMRGYAETRGCRREFLLTYFGEAFEPPCGTCDNCVAGASAPADTGPYPLNSRVVHRAWGEGTVLRYDGDDVVVLFDDVGYRTLSLTLVNERGLLQAR